MKQEREGRRGEVKNCIPCLLTKYGAGSSGMANPVLMALAAANFFWEHSYLIFRKSFDLSSPPKAHLRILFYFCYISIFYKFSHFIIRYKY